MRIERYTWPVPLICCIALSSESLVRATTLVVKATWDGEGTLKYRVKSDLHGASADDWLRDEAIAILGDHERGVKLFDFKATGPADAELHLRMHRPAGSAVDWSQDRVLLEISVRKPGAQSPIASHDFEVLNPKDPERPTYADGWLRDKIAEQVATGSLYATVFSEVPIKATAWLEDHGIIDTDQKANLELGKVLLGIRAKTEVAGILQKLRFVHCGQDHIRGLVRDDLPRDGDSCAPPGKSFVGPETHWTEIYVVKAVRGD